MGTTAPIRYSAADRRQQILDVALKLFARHGFQGTTTRRIAQAAAVNEALIFRHFPTKEELYWAVLQRECDREGGPGAFQQKLVTHQGVDRELFVGIACEILDRRSRDTTLSRLLLFSALENHRLSQRFFRTYLAQYFETLARYIQDGIEDGRFRALDPMLAARGFLGMVVYHAWVQELFAWKQVQKFNNRDVAQTLTDIWFAGMLLPAREAKTVAPRTGRNGSSQTNNSNGSRKR
jgi:AcrR family transcriptional regulator